MRRTALVGLSVLLVSCMDPPTSKRELIDKGRSSDKICSRDSLINVESRFDEYFGRCINSVKIVTNPAKDSPTDFLVKESENRRIQYVFRIAMRDEIAYTLAIDLEDNGVNKECTTSIKGYAYNIFWAQHFDRFNDLAIDGEASCP